MLSILLYAGYSVNLYINKKIYNEYKSVKCELGSQTEASVPISELEVNGKYNYINKLKLADVCTLIFLIL